jgi:pyruvate/2-oxoglutarate/acetoin dehydrogenase E1 component
VDKERDAALKELAQAVAARPPVENSIASARAALKEKYGEMTLIEASLTCGGFEGVTLFTDATGRTPSPTFIVLGYVYPVVRAVLQIFYFLFYWK